MTSRFEKTINESIRKTIHRFRLRPLSCFTESDLHSSLQRDLLINNSKHFYFDNKVSLVHHEYPTNFRYKKADLLKGYKYDSIKPENHPTSFNSNKYRGRGHYDLAILNPKFVRESLDINNDIIDIKSVVNKDNELLKKRYNESDYGLAKIQKEVLYAFEFKFIHHFNSGHCSMLKEVITDNEKLKLALYHSGHFIKPVNLIFCAAPIEEETENIQSVIGKVRDYIKTGKIDLDYTDIKEEKSIPEGVANIFVQSYYVKEKKDTPKAIIFCRNPQKWVYNLAKQLGLDLIKGE